MQSPRTKNQSSFTLLELLIVIAIIAILAATVMVSLSSTRQSAWEARGMQFSQNIKTTLADSLVGEWSFDDQSNPGRDDSGNGNNGTIYKSSAGGTCTGYPNPQSGCPQLVNGKVRGALNFDGVDDYILSSFNNVTFSSNSDYTFTLWIKPISKDPTNDTFLHIRASSYVWQFQLRQTSTGQLSWVILKSDSNTYTYSFNRILELEKWYHIVVNVGERVRLYLNGTEVGNYTRQTEVSRIFNGLWIGSEAGSGWFTNSIIEEVQVYNTALTSYEIKALYAEGKMRHLADR